MTYIAGQLCLAASASTAKKFKKTKLWIAKKEDYEYNLHYKFAKAL